MRRISALVLVLAAAAAGIALAARDPSGGARVELLPDLDQAPPSAVAVITRESGASKRYLLTFGSAVDNVGSGPLVVDGRRASRSDPTMSLVQVVRRSDGVRVRRAVRGAIRYEHEATHSHWHFLRFERYELRRARDHVRVAPSRKSGFCLGDRYNTVRGRLPHEPERPVYTTNCGKDKPWLLGLRVGISVGYGDDYPPTKEGQYVDVTRVPAGRYELVHRVNVGRALREERYANNASSVLIELRRPRSRTPTVRVLAVCPDSAVCRP